MKRLRWELLNALRAIGLAGWVGLALVLLSAAAWWGVVTPMQDEARQLDADSIHTPGIFVQRMIVNTAYKKPIEQRTVRTRETA